VAAAAVTAPPAITPDAATHAATRAAPAALVPARTPGTKWFLRTIVPRRERTRVTILNTIIPLPLEGITQEYAQADRLANTWMTFRETHPHSALKCA